MDLARFIFRSKLGGISLSIATAKPAISKLLTYNTKFIISVIQ